MTDPNPLTLRVAIVGAGPAGIYAGNILANSVTEAGGAVAIDLFDSLPAPYGLIRYGVAPDHPRIKGIVNSLHEMLDAGTIRFIGNVEVVPGITSAISVPAIAGIPLTHRGLATAFTVVTGHDQIEALSGGRDHTVVLLMGVGTLAHSAITLARGLRGADCPVAVVEDGFGARQRVTVGTLDTIAAQAAERGIRSPAVVVVGDVVRLSPYCPAELAVSALAVSDDLSARLAAEHTPERPSK